MGCLNGESTSSGSVCRTNTRDGTILGLCTKCFFGRPALQNEQEMFRVNQGYDNRDPCEESQIKQSAYAYSHEGDHQHLQKRNSTS